MLQPSCCNRFGLGKGFYVVTEHFYVATEFGQDQGFLIATQYFYVATKNLMSRQSCLKLCHDRVYLMLR